eukprot:gene39072-51416_t
MDFPAWATPGELRKIYSKARTLGADDFTLSDADAVKGFLEAKSAGSGSNETIEMLKIVIEQTKPKMTHYDDIASKIRSVVRNAFFDCVEYPFDAELPLFKRFGDDGSKARLLKKEVLRYSQQMRKNYLSNEVREDAVQAEIINEFWPNTKSCFSDEPHEMVHEVPYSLKLSDDRISATISGKVDHGVKRLNSDLKSLTLEDKAQDTVLRSHIAQAVSQVAFEVRRLRTSLHYVPELYIGLLQNGRSWVAILRKVVCGEVLLTYIEAPAAFEVAGRKVSEVNDVNCEKIARLIEHAYCVANQITLEILNPSMRPANLPYSIKEEYNEDDEDESEGGSGDYRNRDGYAGKKDDRDGSGKRSGSEDKRGKNRNADDGAGSYSSAPGGGGK